MGIRTLLFLGLSIINTSALWGTQVPRLLLSAWTCTIPCETNDEPPQTLPSLNIAWCAVEVLGPKMIAQMTPLCKKLNRTSNARAMRRSTGGSPAKCQVSGNACSPEGPTKVGFGCSVVCPDDPLPRRFSVCAHDGSEAWSFASQICAHPTMPAVLPQAIVCDPNGQTPCGD